MVTAGSLCSKVVLVTGATSGMGRATALRSAADGARVVVAGRNEEAGEETVSAIREKGGTAFFARCDVTAESDCAALVERALSTYGNLDCVFNNAGVLGAKGLLTEIDTADWWNEVEVNLGGVYLGMKHQIPALVAGGGGAIVNNASLLGVRGTPRASAYVAAKHGVVGLTRAAALEFAAHGVRVNALVTGPVDTPALTSTTGHVDRVAIVADAAAHTPVGRVGEPGEVAAFTAFLFSDEARFITGAALAVDGGMSA